MFIEQPPWFFRSAVSTSHLPDGPKRTSCLPDFDDGPIPGSYPLGTGATEETRY